LINIPTRGLSAEMRSYCSALILRKVDHIEAKRREGDRINAVLAAAGYNFSLLLRWFRRFLRTLLLILARAVLASGFA
jgi:transposase, IS5 family